MLVFLKAIIHAILNRMPLNQHKQSEHLDKVVPKQHSLYDDVVNSPAAVNTLLFQGVPGPQAIEKNHECDPDNLFTWDVMEGRGSGSTGEARFKCRTCSREMFLGGWGSELWLDPSVVRRNQAKQAA